MNNNDEMIRYIESDHDTILLPKNIKLMMSRSMLNTIVPDLDDWWYLSSKGHVYHNLTKHWIVSIDQFLFKYGTAERFKCQTDDPYWSFYLVCGYQKFRDVLLTVIDRIDSKKISLLEDLVIKLNDGEFYTMNAKFVSINDQKEYSLSVFRKEDEIDG